MNMKNYNKLFETAAVFCGLIASTGCDKFLTTSPYDQVSDATALSTTAQIQMSLTSAYDQLLFNSSGGADRLFGGIHGLQLFWDERGEDIMSHSNMGGYQCSSYNFAPSFTKADGDANVMWTYCYKLINQCNIIIDALPDASGSEVQKTEIYGQAKAMRAMAYFLLIQTYQQTYVIAKDKRGVILRLKATDPDEMGFSTVQQVYDQIVKDFTDAKAELSSFSREYIWQINTDVVNGWLARVYQVMNNWPEAYKCAKAVYDTHNTLMTKEQWYSGFDDCIANKYAEVFWAMSYTDENNHGGDTCFNFWYNQDPETYGEGQSGIYRFFNLFTTQEYVDLFDDTDWRGAKIPYSQAHVSEAEERGVMFWRRTENASSDIGTKWAYNKFKHDGDAAKNTRPDFCLMRGTEMLLIMAEAQANLGESEALSLLNKLQSSRDAKLTSTADKNVLLDAIYKERRKELLGEGVTGQYDLVRLQKDLVRYAATDAKPWEHYYWGVQYLDGYNAGDTEPKGVLPSNDYRWFFQIPSDEFSYNTAITQDDQNPFSGK